MSRAAFVVVSSFCMFGVLAACRSPDKRATPEPTIIVTPVHVASDAAGVAIAADAAAAAVDAGAGIHCGEDTTLPLHDLVALPIVLFPKDQLPPQKKGWSVPARFDEEQPPKAPNPTSTPPSASRPAKNNRIVLGDATLKQCDSLTPYDKPIQGPFDAMPSSDATWTLTLYGGENNALVAVRDGANALIAVRHLSIRGGTGTGAGMKELALFPGGKNVAIWAYDSADGIDGHTRWLIGFRDNELRVLLQDDEQNAMGSLDTFEFTPAAAAPTANPSIVITYAIRDSVLSEEDGGFRPQKALSRKRTVRWDATKQVFR